MEAAHTINIHEYMVPTEVQANHSDHRWWEAVDDQLAMKLRTHFGSAMNNLKLVARQQVSWRGGGRSYYSNRDQDKIRGKRVLLLGFEYTYGNRDITFTRGYREKYEPLDTHFDIHVRNVHYIKWSRTKDRWGYWHHRSGLDLEHTTAVGIEIEFEGQHIWLYTNLELAEDFFGIYVNRDGNIVATDGRVFDKCPAISYFFDGNNFDFSLDSYRAMTRLDLRPRSLNNLVHNEAQKFKFTPTDELRKQGFVKLYKAKRDLGEKLFENADYLHWMAWREALKNGHRTINKVKVSAVLSKYFADVETVEELKAKLQPFVDSSDHYSPFDTAFQNLDVFTSKRKEIVKKDTSRAIRKRVQDLDEIDLDKKKYPKTYKALTEGEIPLTCIFPSQETYFLINDNWKLWEEMLKRFPEETKKAAQAAGARKQYERDLMSYFFFVLYSLPEYLKKHTGYKWTCSPRLVTSQYELEPEAVDEDRGVTKRRSALTPVADNEKHHVVVPYASMAVHGHYTTYCYAHSYHVLRRGMSFDGSVVMQDLEKELNGKDDYGLMFYTLTGSVSNRGYPTFLIIFERLESQKRTRVHFHRVHSTRSKAGDRNPISNWTKVAYNWMIGNVNKNSIAFQQGDMAFLHVPDTKMAKLDFENAEKVRDCDSHCFEKPVDFVKYEGKEKHVIGHIRFEGPNKLQHPEHDDIEIQVGGTFQIRQCRSWEANPKGVWTINYD